jgi:hypothetical protein
MNLLTSRLTRLALVPAVGLISLASALGLASAHPAAPDRTETPRLCDSMAHVKVGDLGGGWANDGEFVVLTHVGSSVTGIAFYEEGGTASYTGCFDGHTFYLDYSNAVDAGYGQLTVSGDGQTLSGYWYSYNDNGNHHSWTLTRVF